MSVVTDREGNERTGAKVAVELGGEKQKASDDLHILL